MKHNLKTLEDYLLKEEKKACEDDEDSVYDALIFVGAELRKIIKELRQLKQVFLKEWLEHPEKSWLLRRTEFIDEVLGETT